MAKAKGNRMRRTLCVFLTLLALFLVGTVVVLSTVVSYFGVDWRDVITEPEMKRYEKLALEAVPGKIPRIIHQTWKTEDVPERWEGVRRECMDLHPDYEYKLWSDAASRDFIATEYPWFLSAFDGYPYPIQRADAIRYFVLHHFGGVYMDLDVGCKRNMDPLLHFQVILPATIPVGVSNDIMFAEKGHPFMDLVIHNLVTFNHQYGTNYPTVMFSTGPMFLSAQYGLWPKEDIEVSDRQVRVLPRRWYGKNAPATEMEDSFFDHFYGSSWHADDAGFITFLGKFGMALMYIGFAIVILGAVRLLWSKRTFLKTQSQRQLGPIALPFHVGADGLPFARPGTPGAGSRPGSPIGSRSSTPNGDRSRQNSGNGRQGALYYLPVWFMPPGDGNARAPGPTSPSQAHGWSQYLPNLSFVEEDAEHRYHPVPNFSRPPSPSNNSILHAPGAMHDGAFDGTPLHSIHSPKPIVPPSSSASARADTFSPPPPTSPNPPSYSSLKSWGSALFRSPRAALLPLVNPGGSSQLGSPPAEDHRDRDGFFVPGHHKSASSTSAATFFSSLAGGAAPPRARSPLPQYQPSHSPSASQSVPDHGGRGSMVRFSPQQSAGTGTAPTGSSHPASEDESGVEEGGAADEIEGGIGSGDEYAGSGVGVEEEVDRLLSEMEPDFEAKLARERRGE